MVSSTFSFYKAYDHFYEVVQNNIRGNGSILEIGGGAHPAVVDRSNLSYTILDPDKEELSKSPEDVIKINTSIEGYDGEEKFDVVLSKMVLEHVQFPNQFHQKILETLKNDGTVIHFFACRHSIPSLANRLLPEKVGDFILKKLKNRNTDDHPKYPAFYKRTKGGTRQQIQYFENLGYRVESYSSYVGHKYFRSVPILNQIEKLYTRLLVFFKMKSLATVAIVILRHKNFKQAD